MFTFVYSPIRDVENSTSAEIVAKAFYTDDTGITCRISALEAGIVHAFLSEAGEDHQGRIVAFISRFDPITLKLFE